MEDATIEDRLAKLERLAAIVSEEGPKLMDQVKRLAAAQAMLQAAPDLVARFAALVVRVKGIDGRSE